MSKKVIIFSLVLTLLVVSTSFILLGSFDLVDAQSNDVIGQVKGWMWSSNVGWVKADSNLTKPVKVVNDNWEGYAWSSSLGWLNFNPTATATDYPGEPRHGVRMTTDNKVEGWARFCSVFRSGCDGELRPNSERGGWDGWIKMINVRKEANTGGLLGFAWGGLNVGWVNLGYLTGDGSQPPPAGGCPVELIDTNNDGLGDCCPSYQICTAVGPGTGPSVSCSVIPANGKVDDEFTWFVNGLTGFSGNPQDYTYIWSGDDLNEQGGYWNNLISRQEVKVTYSTAGQKTASVTVTDSNNRTATADCRIGPNYYIVVDNGDEPESCTFSISPDQALISLTFINPIIGNSYYSARSNSLQISFVPPNCSPLSLSSNDFPVGSEMVCSVNNSEWETCDNLFGNVLVGVKAIYGKTGEDLLANGCKLVTIENKDDPENKIQRPVCIRGSSSN